MRQIFCGSGGIIFLRKKLLHAQRFLSIDELLIGDGFFYV